MKTDKPLISIVMAVYEPRLDWLCEQLESLNSQTYRHLELIICDDCSSTVSYESITMIVAKCITAFNYNIYRNDKNLGSNSTFERLTKEAKGDYIAYCDQDDIWLPEKIEILYKAIVESKALLVCSDMYIINEHSIRTAESITKIRKHHIFRNGEGLAPKLLFSNFVTGCTMLIRSKEAKNAIPFCPHMVHDHWLALYCADRGKIISISDKLISYRIHSSNQTPIMAGVYDKNSYLQIRVVEYLHRMEWLIENFNCTPEVVVTIQSGIKWLQARKNNLEVRRGAKTIWKYRSYSFIPSLFEIIATYFPNKLFMFFIYMNKKNLI